VPDGRHAFLFSPASPLPGIMAPVRAAERFRSGFVLSLLLAAVSVAAETPGLSTPPAGARLLPGTVLVTAWDSEASAEGFDEGELVLSLDGGRTFPVRLTAEIEPGERRAQWRVPALPTAHARLAIRFGREDDLDTERIANVSAEFEILADAEAPDERIFRVGGEWRTREAMEPRPRRIPASALAPPSALAALCEPDASVDAPRPGPLETPGLHRAEIPSRAAEQPAATRGAIRASGPASSPLRL